MAVGLINSAFPVLGWLDAWMAGGLPDLARLCLWGMLCGCAAMLLYSWSSDQSGITELKAQIRDLQRRMLKDDMDQTKVMRLAKSNLSVSFKLLAKVIGPSMLASLPVLLIVVWLSIFQSHRAPLSAETVEVEVIPATVILEFLPVSAFVQGPGTLDLVAGDTQRSIKVMNAGAVVYEGNAEAPPAAAIYQKQWWNLHVGNPAGYIRTGAPVEEIRLHFPRKIFLSGVPGWLATWKFPFFMSILIAALALKLGLRIE